MLGELAMPRPPEQQCEHTERLVGNWLFLHGELVFEQQGETSLWSSGGAGFPAPGGGTQSSRSSGGGMRRAGFPRVFHPPRAVGGLAEPVTAPCPPGASLGAGGAACAPRTGPSAAALHGVCSIPGRPIEPFPWGMCPGGRASPAKGTGVPAATCPCRRRASPRHSPWGPSGNGAMLPTFGGIRGISRAGRLPSLLMHQCYRRFQSLRNLAADKILGVYCIFWQLLRK